MVVYSGDFGQTQKRFSDAKPYKTEEAERERERERELYGKCVGKRENGFVGITRPQK
jgi:hypothetical protein